MIKGFTRYSFFIVCLLSLFVFRSNNSHGQTVVWSEAFDVSTVIGTGGWDLNVITMTTTATDPNYWVINDNEGGVAPPGCGVASNGDMTLHITSTLFPTSGAAYNAGGLCGGGICVETHTRADSPPFSTVGFTNLSFNFDFIAQGEANADFFTIWYDDGGGFTQLGAPLTSAMCNPQGQWTAFTVPLPASCENNPAVRVAFHWDNDDNGIGSDPSVAINNASVTSTSASPAPVASFTASSLLICEGDCIDFTDASTGNPTGWTWTFNGAATTTSSVQNPTGICYNTAGFYDVTLSATNASGTDDTTMVAVIEVITCAGPPTASFTTANTTICEGDCIDFTDASLGSPTGWTWTFNGAATTTSSVQNPTGICYNTAGFYDVTLSVQNGTGTDDSTMVAYIEVVTCSNPPNVNFSASDSTLCENDCINFTDLSTGSPTSWLWDFPGATTTSSTDQNPQNVCYPTAGSYSVTLTATNANGTGDTTITSFITVTACSNPTSSFTMSSSTFCNGSCITFADNSTGGVSSYLWTFVGGVPNTSTSADPGEVCYSSAGTYDVILEVTNSSGTSTSTQTVTVNQTPSSIDAGPDQFMSSGESVDISVVGGGSTGTYVWEPSDGLDCATCADVVATPIETTEYIVYYYQDGCFTSDTIIVDVTIVEAFGLPNAFSPNGDGVNDILYVKGNALSSMRLLIYNRYGQQVFEATDQADGWDGTHKGKALNPGVFVYYLEVEFVNGAGAVQKGNITLMH